MYVVVIIGVVLAAVAYGWDGGARGLVKPVLGTTAMTLAPAAAGAALMVYTEVKKRSLARSKAQGESGASAFASRHVRMLKLVNASAVAAYATSLYAFSWAAMPARLGLDRWSTATGATIVAPFIMSLVLVWIPLHYTEAAMRSWAPTLSQRLAFNLRQYVLTLLVPIGVVLLVYDISSLLPESLAARLENPWTEGLLGFGIVLGGYTLAPLLVVRLWKTRPLPDSPARERLKSLCARARVRFRDIRIWETPGHYVVNAAVMGITGRVRYIIVSRTLLEVMPASQVEAVFAHELGHAKRRHMVFYLLFAADFVLLAHLFDVLAGGPFQAASAYPLPTYAGLIAASLLYWGLGFGYVSRAFERDADLFATETAGNGRAFASALSTIANLNGVSPSAPSWRHGSIASRIAFLESAAASAEVGRNFQQRLAFLKALLVAAAALSLAGIGLAERLL